LTQRRILLTLQPPLMAPTREGLLRQIITKPPVPASWRNRAIPQQLQGIVHKAIAKDPDDRYSSGSAFATDLQAPAMALLVACSGDAEEDVI